MVNYVICKQYLYNLKMANLISYHLKKFQFEIFNRIILLKYLIQSA